MEYIILNNGVKIPKSGFGVWQLRSNECEEAVKTAINNNYRLIDTASAYENEVEVGNALREVDVKREELFITTKLWVQNYGYKETKEAFERSLKRLKLEYIDMYLLHWPYGRYIEAWKALEELYKEGKVRAIGVCNFGINELDYLMKNSSVKPAVNQVELHPLLQENDLVKYMKENNIQVQAWGALFQGNKGKAVDNEILNEIARKYNKTVYQIILRWHIERGIIPIARSSKENHIKSNIDVFDFSLTQEDMNKISSLNKNERNNPMVDPNNPKWKETVLGWRIDI